MKVIRNKLIPFKGFKAINLFGILFVRKEAIMNERTMNHEKIHTAQMQELGYVFFYLWYVVEWILRLFMKGNAYRNIKFEQEAYTNETEKDYLRMRKHYSWLRFF